MKKKITAFILAAAMVFTILPMTVLAATTNFSFNAYFVMNSPGAQYEYVNYAASGVTGSWKSYNASSVSLTGTNGKTVTGSKLTYSVSSDNSNPFEASNLYVRIPKTDINGCNNDVYVYALFKDTAAFNSFTSGKFGSLDWRNLDTSKIVGDFWRTRSYVLENESYRYLKWDNPHIFMLEENPQLNLIMERYSYQQNAVSVKVTEMSRLVPSETNSDKFESNELTIKGTYTNNANYPVNVLASKPTLDALESYYNNPITLESRNLVASKSSPEIIPWDTTWIGSQPDANCAAFTIMPGKTVELTWVYNVGLDPVKSIPGSDEVYRVTLGAQNHSVPLSKSREYTSASSFTYVNSGNSVAAQNFELLGSYPQKMGLNDVSQKLYLSVRCASKLNQMNGKPHIVINAGDTYGAVVPTVLDQQHIDISTDGVIALDLSTYIDDTIEQKYTVRMSDGIRPYDITFEVAKNYTSAQLTPMFNLEIVQDSVGDFKVLNYANNYSSNKRLFSATGLITGNSVDGVTTYQIPHNSMINGCLRYSGSNGNATAVLDASANTVTVTFPNGSSLFYDDWVMANGPCTLTLRDGETYVSEPTSASNVKFPTIEYGTRMELTVPVLETVARVDGIRLYNNGFSLSGGINLANNIPEYFRNFFDAELELEELRFGMNLSGNKNTTEFKGIKAHGTVKLTTDDALVIVGVGGDLEVSIDTLPESNPQEISVKGAFDIADILSAEGELVLQDVDRGVFLPQTLKFSFPPEIILLPPAPVVIIDQIGLGFDNLVSTIRYDLGTWTVVPPLELSGRLGISDITTQLIGGTVMAAIGIGYIKLGFDELMILGNDSFLKNVYGEFRLKDTGATYKIPGTNLIAPIIGPDTNLHGELDIYTIVQGEIHINFGTDTKRMTDSTVKTIEAALNTVKPPITIQKLQNLGIEVCQQLYNMVYFSGSGKVEIKMPQAVPFVGGNTLAGAYASVNKDYLRAKITVPIGMNVGPSGQIDAWVQYSMHSKNLEYGSGTAPFSLPMNNPSEYLIDAVDIDGNPVSISMVTSFIPMSSGIQSFAFSGMYSNSKQQYVGTSSNEFIVEVRSKSNKSGIRVTPPTGLAQDFSATACNWEEVNDESGNLLYYRSNYVAETIAGTWTIETLNEGGTLLDASGQIDCDFFYIAEEPHLSNVTISSNTVSWANKNLETLGKYRVLLSLADSDSDATAGIALTTIDFAGNSPIASATVDLSTIPSENYYIKAHIEQLESTDADGLEIWKPLGTEYSAQFTHTNANAPGNITNATAAPIGNGQVKVDWSTAATNAAGYTIVVTDGSAGKIVGEYDVPNGDATESILTATETGTGMELNTNYTFTVRPYKKLTVTGTPIDGTDMSDTTSTAATTLLYGESATTNPVTITTPVFPTLTLTKRFAVNNEQTIVMSAQPRAKIDPIYAKSSHELIVSNLNSNGTVTAQISQELSSLGDAEIDLSDYADITSTIHDATISLDGLDEGRYWLDVTVTNLNGDSSTFPLTLFIDDTPPALIATDKTQTEDGWFVFGNTEDGIAEFFFNGDIVTDLLAFGTFAIPVSAAEPYIELTARDFAGNFTTITKGYEIAQYSEGDETSLTVTVPRDGIIVMGEVGFTATASVADNITWSVVSGAGVVSIDANGIIMPIKNGEAVVAASYKGGVLTATAAVTVVSSNPIVDLYISDFGATSTTLHFTEPVDVTSKALQYSLDQSEWINLTEGVSFDGSGEVTVSGIAYLKTVYFRVAVTGGVNAGTSNVASRMGTQANEVNDIEISEDFYNQFFKNEDSSNYKFIIGTDGEVYIIGGVTAGMKVADLELANNVKVYNGSKEVTGKLGTGMEIRKGDVAVMVVIKGDLTANGAPGINDAQSLLEYLVGNKTFSEAQRLAMGDIVNENDSAIKKLRAFLNFVMTE